MQKMAMKIHAVGRLWETRMVNAVWAVWLQLEEFHFSLHEDAVLGQVSYLALGTDFTTLGTATTVSLFAFPKHFSP